VYKGEWLIFLFGAVIVAIILAMSTLFLIKAIRRAKEIGMDSAKIRGAVRSSVVFSIVPSIPIVIGIGIMMPWLGLAIPWIRLSVIGALQYEIIAMDQATAASGVTSYMGMTPEIIATAFVIMTLSILSGPVFNAIAYKKYQHKLSELREKNQTLLNTITGSLLGGILAGLASYIIAGGILNVRSTGSDSIPVSGAVTLLTLGVSAAIMLICGLLIKVLKWKWLENYALPITILGALGCAFAFIPLFPV
jgi:heme/copper-type cytochrome/quinol oxidase subunit 2